MSHLGRSIDMINLKGFPRATVHARPIRLDPRCPAFCSPPPLILRLLRRIRIRHVEMLALNHLTWDEVEHIGIEPMTPCLRSRCSTN